jgi:hypothetical protein
MNEIRDGNHYEGIGVFDLSDVLGYICTEDITISEIATLVKNRFVMLSSCTGNLIRIGNSQDNILNTFSEANCLRTRNATSNILIDNITKCEPIAKRLSTSKENYVMMVSTCEPKRKRMGNPNKNVIVFFSYCEPKVARYKKVKDLNGLRLCDLEGKVIRNICEAN